MTVVEENRQCPICEQIVQADMEFIAIKVAPFRAVRIHEGCARLVFDAYTHKWTLAAIQRDQEATDSLEEEDF